MPATLPVSDRIRSQTLFLLASQHQDGTTETDGVTVSDASGAYVADAVDADGISQTVAVNTVDDVDADAEIADFIDADTETERL